MEASANEDESVSLKEIEEQELWAGFCRRKEAEIQTHRETKDAKRTIDRKERIEKSL